MFSERTNWKLTQNLLTRAIEEARSNGVEVIDLTMSNPTRAGLQYDNEAIVSAFQNAGMMDYDPQPKGLLKAREAVADYYHQDHDVFGLDPERLILTASTSEAYSYIFRLLCNAGDEVLVPKPSYPLFEFLADLHDTKLEPYPLIYDHGWQIDIASLYKKVTPRTRAVVVVHPNNPTGSFASAQEIDALNDFCREYDLAIVSDEVFLDYAHDGAQRKSLVNKASVLTFVMSGLSKISCLPQMKLGWLITNGPEGKVQQAMARLEIIADTYLSVSTPVQNALRALLEQRKRIQPLVLDRLRENLQAMDRVVSSQKSCKRLVVDGGWYAMLRVPVTQSDDELVVDLLRKVGVLVHPGHFFDFADDGHLVVSLITPTDQFQQGVTRILDVVHT